MDLLHTGGNAGRFWVAPRFPELSWFKKSSWFGGKKVIRDNVKDLLDIVQAV